MKQISCEELKKKIDQKDDFKLVNCLSQARFRAKHIPGSINIPITPDSVQNISALKEVVQKLLAEDDEIVVYCSDVGCLASIYLYQRLEEFGYKKIDRFAGGLRVWEEDGHALVGEMVT